VDLYHANPRMGSELRDELVDTLSLDPGRPILLRSVAPRARRSRVEPTGYYDVLWQPVNRAYNARVSKVIFQPKRIFRHELK